LLLLSLNVRGEWRLIWRDEFDGASIDTNKWTFDIGNGAPTLPGWGNNEKQFYTSRPQNAQVSNGILHIIAQKESTNGFSYTSARLKTKDLFARAWGRFEFRAKAPSGLGYWSALWMLPENSAYGSWAASGEIDVMEIKGAEMNRVFGTIHFGGSWPKNAQAGAAYKFANGGTASDFHVYQLDWTTNTIGWSVDGVTYKKQTNWWSAGGPFPAPFDQPFYILMNLAVGGNYLKNPEANTINARTEFPGELQVDYVRVYEKIENAPATMPKGGKAN
jgi:beta-glucanase (GH16 family)